MNPRSPYTYPNRILIVVSGLSPQVVTETVYALTQDKGSPPFIPTRVIVVTTGDGARIAEESLFGPHDQFSKLCREYELAGIRFTPADIRCARGPRGVVDADAHDEASLNRMGDLLLKTMCEFAQPDAALHVSIAGGRKSMSYLAGAVLMLIGRPQDRLSHAVLGDARLERSPHFFFPSRRKKPVLYENKETRKAELIPADRVTVHLADVPFLRIAELLPPLVDVDRPQALSDLIAEAQKALTEPERATVEINTYERWVQCNGRPIPFKPVEFAFYYTLARRGRNGLHAQASDEECLDYLEHLSHVTPEGAKLRQQKRYPDNAQELFDKWFWTDYNKGNPLWHDDLNTENQKDRLRQRGDKFSPDRANVNKALRNALGVVGCRRFEVESRGGLYTLREDLEIRWIDERACKAK